MLTALRPRNAAAAACPLSITDCGCTISFPGDYQLGNGLSLNSPGLCIDIIASNVTLDAAGDVISGPGSNTTSVGIHVEATANKVGLHRVTVVNFGTGIVIDGARADVEYVTTEHDNRGTVVNGARAFLYGHFSISDNLVGILVNSSATNFVGQALSIDNTQGTGIKLNGVTGAFIDDATVYGAATFGIWLRSASNNIIDGFTAESNNIAGIYLGCNPSGPNGKPCPAGVPASNGNTFSGSHYCAASSIASNTGSPYNQSYGIGVGLGNLHNNFLSTLAFNNSIFDALDENTNCTNFFFAVEFGNFKGVCDKGA
jgi:parallel beta-helix repeat protein